MGSIENQHEGDITDATTIIIALSTKYDHGSALNLPQKVEQKI